MLPNAEYSLLYIGGDVKAHSLENDGPVQERRLTVRSFLPAALF